MQTKRTRRWGLKGESEIRGKPQGRPIILDVLHYGGFTTYKKLRKSLRGLDDRIGQHGTLQIHVAGITEDFKDCTFLHYEPGQGEDAGPLEDTGGTIDGGWWQEITFIFRQNKVTAGA